MDYAVSGAKRGTDQFTIPYSLFFAPAFRLPNPESRILAPIAYYGSLSCLACQETGSLLSRQNDNVRFQQSRNVLFHSVKLDGWKNRRC